MFLARWRYDFKLIGRQAFFTPLLLMGSFALLSVLLRTMSVSPSRFLSSGLEMFLPAVMGIIVATTSTFDPTLELQLTLPRSYAATALRRLCLLTGWSACVALLSSGLLALCHLSYPPQQIQNWPVMVQILATQMIWLVPLLWFVAAGLCLTLLTRSRTASGALLAGIWIVETLFMGPIITNNPWLQPMALFPTTMMPGASFWLSNRVELLLVALLLLPINWLLLRNIEGLLKEMSEEA